MQPNKTLKITEFQLMRTYMSNDIRLIELSSYIRPKLVENKSKNWVLNGKNNEFYQYIIDRFNGSPTNAAIITSYIDLIYGRGIGVRNKNNTAWIKLKTILKKKDLKRIIADFELFGEASFQVIRTKSGKDISSIEHIAKNLVVPSIENEDGNITSYWYSKDWTNIYKYKPEEIPAWGSNKPIEIYCIKPYKAGKNYFSDPDYISCLPYAEIEEELSNFYINSIKKGLTAGYIVNIPDGSLTIEQKKDLELKIKEKLTGSPNAMSFVLNFHGRDAEITIIPIPVNENQHKQWEYLTGEARQQIMTGHKVVSPKLFGIMSDGGLGNNANELDEAEAQLMKRVISPKQEYILDALEEVLTEYSYNLDLFFIPLSDQPVQLSSDEKKKSELDLFFESFEDEDLNDYELAECVAVTDEETESIQFASTGTAKPLQKSRFDLFDTVTRFRYAGNEKGQREFCRKMLAANKVYRIEDIEAMSALPVNDGFGPEGASTYNIFKYKGGVNCKHYWEKLTYKRRNEGVKVDVKSPIAIEDAKKQPAKGLAGIEPINMPNRGALNK